MSQPRFEIPESHQLFVGGEFVDAQDGATFETVDPATEAPLSQVASAKAADVDKAVAAARTALTSKAWVRASGHDRSKMLFAIAQGIREHADELAELESRDNGKPVGEARFVDIEAAATCFQYYAGWASKIEGRTIPVSGPFFTYSSREPIGVVGQIIPWNFPLLMAAWKLGPALAAGCTSVLKPAEQTPLTALRLARILQDAGIPPGVVNILPGLGHEAGKALVAHKGVDKLAFTGSTPVGIEIARQAAANLVPVTLELGGKSPNIVFADADLDAAAKGASVGIFYNAGEVCTAGSRLLVEKSVYSEFLEKMQTMAGKMRPGNPLDPKTRLGPVVTKEQQERVLGYVKKGKEEGAELVCGGNAAQIEGKGYYVEPTVFAGVKPEMTIAQEEIFGPVVSVIPFEDEAEALALANQTVYGLASGVWTKDLARAHRMAAGIEAGTVWVNTYNNFDSAAPFGGRGQSGYGRELGAEGIEPYLKKKTVWINLKG